MSIGVQLLLIYKKTDDHLHKRIWRNRVSGVIGKRRNIRAPVRTWEAREDNHAHRFPQLPFPPPPFRSPHFFSLVSASDTTI